MHRSRLLVLAPFAAAAACSQRKDTERFQGLKDDSTLVATLAYQNPDTNTDKPAFPEACGTFMIPSPAAADKARAEQIAQQAYSSEMIGNITEANAMLRRASSLDATDKNAAYHLGRTSEALGQRKAAIAAYCRYLALSPTKGEGAEARQRVRALSESQTAVAAVTVRHPTRASRRTRAKASMSAVANGAIDLPQNQSQSIRRRPPNDARARS